MNFQSSMSQYNHRDSTLFWTQYFFLSLFNAYHEIAIALTAEKIMSPLVSAVSNISYLLSEQNLFWEELEWYVRETHVWIPDLLFSDHVTLEELCKLFKLWFALLKNEDDDSFNLCDSHGTDLRREESVCYGPWYLQPQGLAPLQRLVRSRSHHNSVYI